MCMCACMWLGVCTCVWLCVSVCMHEVACMPVCAWVRLCVCLVHMAVCGCVFPSLPPSFFLSEMKKNIFFFKKERRLQLTSPRKGKEPCSELSALQ